MKHDPLISMIIPIYNSERFLRFCLDSVICQTYNNLEILLIDDGSTDNSLNICYEYQKCDKRIKVFHKENGGSSSARNFGLDICKGEYVSFVDADDIIQKDFLAKLYECILYSKADISVCSCIRIDENGHLIGKITFKEKRLFGDSIYDIPTYGGSWVWNKLYKKSLIGNVRFKTSIEFSEDTNFNYQLSLKANAIFVSSRLLYFYRENSRSVVHKYMSLENLSGCSNVHFNQICQVAQRSNDKTTLNGILKNYLFYTKQLITMDSFPKWHGKDEALHKFVQIRKMIRKIVSTRNRFMILKMRIYIYIQNTTGLAKYKMIIKKFVALLYLFRKIDKNKVFVINFFGAPYEGGIQKISDELKKIRPNIKIVCALSDFNCYVPYGINKVRYKSLKYYKEFYTSKVIITNIRNNLPRFKRIGQFNIQIWHGLYGGKKVEADAINSLSKSYVKCAKRDGKHTDLMISSSRAQTNLFYKSFWYKGPVLECGLPDLATLFKRETHFEIRNKLCDKLSIPRNKKLLLYAPTFRSNYPKGVYDIGFEKILPILNAKFNGQFVVLFHYHKNIPRSNYPDVVYDNIVYFDATKIEIDELEISTDVLIGDYSSVNIEIALLGKPVFRYVKDLDEYKKDRNFYINFEDIPFPYASNDTELIKIIKRFDIGEYRFKAGRFLKQIGNISNSNVCKEIAEFIINVCKVDSKKRVYKLYKDKLIWPN